MKGGNRDDLIKYKNKFTGEIVFGPMNPKTFLVDGKEFTQIYDSKLRSLKMASDSIVKVK
jgi:hypothetical protein